MRRSPDIIPGFGILTNTHGTPARNRSRYEPVSQGMTLSKKRTKGLCHERVFIA
jgi:hypothetical protein